MSREEARIIEKQQRQARATRHPAPQEDHCILCEGVIEHADQEVFFATGWCRHCSEAMEK
jgi:hypothetical protein